MIRLVTVGLLVAISVSCIGHAQTNEWAWMNGPVTANSADCVYGSLGTAAPENTPGVRLGATTWADKKGNLWLYGGQIFGPGDCGGSDLWEFSSTNNEWALIKGIAYGGVPVYGTKGSPSPDNTPGLREAEVSWTDASGNLWLFGGTSLDSNGLYQYQDDVWEFNPGTNEWTWMSGSNAVNQAGVYGTLGTPAVGNTPGARSGSSSWVDGEGNVWVFGGEGYDSTGTPGGLSDLWELNVSAGRWTWVSGPAIVNQPAVPGTIGVPAAGNVPASGYYDASWIDKTGNLWLFGRVSGLDDLWKYSPATNEWTWMKGDTTVQLLNDPSQPPAGIYGTFETPAPGNTPGGRLGSASWTDIAGNFWLFGGSGRDADGVLGYLNDLWELNPSTIEWAWMGGSSVAVGSCPQTAFQCGQPGVYGALLTSGLGDTPGGRYDDAAWTDSNGNFWLFGGFGFDQIGNGGYLDDLWEYQPNTNNNQVAATPTLSLATGTYTSWQTLEISDSTAGASIYYTLNGNVPAVEYAGPVTISSSETVSAIASASGYANSNIATADYTLNLPATPAPTFSLPSGIYSGAQSVTIADSIPGATIYYAVGGLPAEAFSVYSGPIPVSTSEEIEAFAVADNDSSSSMATAEYNVGPLPSTSPLWTWMSGPSALANVCDTFGSDSNLCLLPGWYGTLGQPSIGNTPGGRIAAAGWTDNAGNLWLFGGNGFDAAGANGLLNDLWKFDPSTAEWTWMGGSAIVGDSCPNQILGEYCGKPGIYGTEGMPSASNFPGGRQWPTHWTDKNGHFWLFGGEGFDANGVLGYLDDLWEYDPSTHEWTWMGGHNALSGTFGAFPAVNSALGTPSPQNWPGTRWYTTSWTDPNGHLWMYGGQGEGVGFLGFSYLSDLWEYDPATNEWAWRNGVLIPSCEQCGWVPTDGSVGIPAPLDSPGSRMMSESWADSGGHLWLFAGWNTDTYAESYLEDDQWVFDPSTNEWTLMVAGSNQPEYGNLGIPSPGNFPTTCAACPNWTDKNGNFWLLGGLTNGGDFTPPGNARDLWWFSPSTDEWTWMGGTATTQSIYGTLGVPGAGDSPSSRGWPVTWTGKDGNLWVFGGGGYDANNAVAILNDLWVYGLAGAPVTAPPQTVAAPTFSLAAGTYGSVQSVTLADATPAAKIYYTTDGSPASGYSPLYSGAIPVTSSETIEAVATAGGYVNSEPVSATYVLNLPAAATPTFNLPGGNYQSVQTITMSDTTPGAAIYYTTNGATPTVGSTLYRGAVTVSSSETIEAVAVASGYSASAVASATYAINLPPPTFALGVSPSSLTVNSGNQGSVTLTVTPQNGFNSVVSFACSGLPSGASCSFSPSTVTPSGSAATTQLTISVGAQAANEHGRANHPFVPLSALAAAVCLIGWKKRRRGLQLVLLAAAFFIVGIISACGGGSSGTGGITSRTERRSSYDKESRPRSFQSFGFRLPRVGGGQNLCWDGQLFPPRGHARDGQRRRGKVCRTLRLRRSQLRAGFQGQGIQT